MGYLAPEAPEQSASSARPVGEVFRAAAPEPASAAPLEPGVGRKGPVQDLEKGHVMMGGVNARAEERAPNVIPWQLEVYVTSPVNLAHGARRLGVQEEFVRPLDREFGEVHLLCPVARVQDPSCGSGKCVLSGPSIPSPHQVTACMLPTNPCRVVTPVVNGRPITSIRTSSRWPYIPERK